MDLQSSNLVLDFDSTFEKLLEVDGGLFKRLRFRGCVRHAKEFYKAYVKKCNEYNECLDFFEPLLGYLVYCGYGYDKSVKYLSEIRTGILSYLEKTVPKNHIGEFDVVGQNN